MVTLGHMVTRHLSLKLWIRNQTIELKHSTARWARPVWKTWFPNIPRFYQQFICEPIGQCNSFVEQPPVPYQIFLIRNFNCNTHPSLAAVFDCSACRACSYQVESRLQKLWRVNHQSLESPDCLVDTSVQFIIMLSRRTNVYLGKLDTIEFLKSRGRVGVVRTEIFVFWDFVAHWTRKHSVK